MPGKASIEIDPEIHSIASVFGALKGLDAESQRRVLDYVREKLGLGASSDFAPNMDEPNSRHRSVNSTASVAVSASEGVSPIAEKWLRRSGLSLSQLEQVFNIGAQDEIDLVASKLPSKKKAARVREVVLMKAAANYLSTGVPKVTHEVVKQTCEHYDAYDVTNFSKALKSISPEISGSKQSGYTLTARGLAAAADLIKQMAGTNGPGT